MTTMTNSDDLDIINGIVARARKAQKAFETGATQQRYDIAAQAAAWAILEPERNRALAELSVATTGLGNVQDKIAKNHNKTLGLMRDLLTARTHGVIRDDPESGITEIARPIGVIGAVVPSTNPAATPANNIINALKGGNAIVLSPSPKGVPACETLLAFIYAEFDKVGLDDDLVQMIPAPGSKDKTQRMLEIVDLVVVTGSQDNVRRAYRCGTPAIGVGAGNVTVIVDETADLAATAFKIAQSKTFDNATSCSAESAVVVLDEVYDQFIDALGQNGGALISESGSQTIVDKLWPNGILNRAVIAQDADKTVEALGLTDKVPADTRFLAVETRGIGPNHPLSGEKLSRVLALYRARDFADATEITRRILMHQGAGHSVGLHSSTKVRALELAETLPTSRVIVNQAHCIATGGAFNNGMAFSLSMGCGSWGGNSIDDNLNWRHFIQSTKVVREITERKPALEDVLAQYWKHVTG
ncbi:acylating sulfoacetaldehyde dehydrogenase [Pseudopelagicola sp. nBUS_20]|uniref:acylating sulfoacetaldehyde dehydrogenase n=1 Tax=Pseudopelagicola sp. nBUS_20 TaxID=3395317 RepID=UPI003EBEC3B7